jgi:hypothetical protein
LHTYVGAWSDARAMPEPNAVETFRAAVEALLPPTDGAPGSADRGAAEFGVRQVEMFLPGFTELAHALLTAYTMGVDPEKTFAQLSLDERRGVLEELSRGETQDMREVLSAIQVFALGGTFSEALEGHEEEWERAGYPGPSRGNPSYRKEGV